MANLNLIVLTGRMTADPELRTIDNGASVVNFSIAVQRGYKPAGAEDYPVDFLDIVAWRKTAEFVGNYFKKGSMITVVGSLETRKYQDKNTGANRTAYEVKADRVYFGDSGKRDQSGSSGGAPAEFGGGFDAGFAPDFTDQGGADDDLPFEPGFPPFNG